MPNPDQPNLARALLALQKEQTSGVLEVRVEGVRTLVFLSDGKPSYAEEGTLDETLGRLLLRRRKLSYEQYKLVIDRMSQAMNRGQQLRFGEAVEGLGFLTTEDVNAALAEQMRSKVVRCLQWEKPEWDFDPSPERLRKMASFPAPVEPMVLAAAKLMPPVRRREVLAPAEGRHPFFCGDTSELAKRYELTAEEEVLVTSMNGVHPYDDSWEEQPIGALLTAFMMAGDVLLLGELEAEAKRASSMLPLKALPLSVPPRPLVLKLSLPPRGKRRALGIMAPPSAAARRETVKMVGRLRHTRRSVVKTVNSPTTKPANVQEARLLAEQAFQTGRGCLRANLLDRAAPLLKRASDLYPEAIEYALYARWVDFRLRKPGDPPTPQQIHALAVKSVKRDPNFAFGHYVLGHLARLDGDAATSVALFAYASKLDPELVDKERHVRIVRPPSIPPAAPPTIPARIPGKAPPLPARALASKAPPPKTPPPSAPAPAVALELPQPENVIDKAPTPAKKPLKMLAGLTACIWGGAILVWAWWGSLPTATATHIATAASTTAMASATGTEVVPAAVSPTVTPTATATASASASAAPPVGMGEVKMPPSAAGHRVFLDGRVLGEGPTTFRVPCGSHTFKIGSAGNPQTLDVPCAGEVTLPE